MDLDEVEDYDELREAVVERGDVATVDMGLLRDVHGAGKLGVNVRSNISKQLRKRGLAHYPEDLPPYQGDLARLYIQGSEVGELIAAALDVSTESDETIRNAVESDAAETLKTIRELVGS